MDNNEEKERLKRITEAMSDAAEAHPEAGDEKFLIFISAGSVMGMAAYGYDDVQDATADLLIHITGIMRQMGGDVRVIPLPDARNN